MKSLLRTTVETEANCGHEGQPVIHRITSHTLGSVHLDIFVTHPSDFFGPGLCSLFTLSMMRMYTSWAGGNGVLRGVSKRPFT